MNIPPLKILSTKNTPLVDYDPDKMKFTLSGISTPENTPEFYRPVFELLEDLQRSSIEGLSIEIKLVYFNSSSSKALFNIFKLIAKIKDRVNIDIIWYCDPDDEDMFDIVDDFSELLEIDIEVAVQELNNPNFYESDE